MRFHRLFKFILITMEIIDSFRWRPCFQMYVVHYLQLTMFRALLCWFDWHNQYYNSILNKYNSEVFVAQQYFFHVVVIKFLPQVFHKDIPAQLWSDLTFFTPYSKQTSLLSSARSEGRSPFERKLYFHSRWKKNLGRGSANCTKKTIPGLNSTKAKVKKQNNVQCLTNIKMY